MLHAITGCTSVQLNVSWSTLLQTMNTDAARAATLTQILEQSSEVWRGSESPTTRARSTTFAELDERLPGGGWPIGAVSELLAIRHGIGELSLVLPAMRAIALDGHPIACVRPPYL